VTLSPLFAANLYLLQSSSGDQAVSNLGAHWGLKASEWITIVAIILGPIMAVVTQFIWQRFRTKRDLKTWVFGTMMSTRATPYHADFVRAVNYIDVVFYKNEKVRDRWKTVLAHLSSDAYKQQNYTPAAFETFKDLLAELLAEMAKDLGYEFDHTHIKNSAWHPSLHGWEFEENIQIRRKLLSLLEGNASLNVVVSPHPSLVQQAGAQAPQTQAGTPPQTIPVQPSPAPMPNPSSPPSDAVTQT
jgi:hypothetical protein